MILAVISLLIALAALIVSITTLWWTHLSRFSPLLTVGNLCQHIYRMTDKGRTWYIPTYDVRINVTNQGARPGVVAGIRLKVHFPDVPILKNREYFFPEFVLDSIKFRNLGYDRKQWIDAAVLSSWIPFTVLPKTTVSQHILFQAYWGEPVIQDKVVCTLEVNTDSHAAWHTIAEWHMNQGMKDFVFMVGSGGSISSVPRNTLERVRRLYPKDLHKYTGTKEALPPLPQMQGRPHNFTQSLGLDDEYQE